MARDSGQYWFPYNEGDELTQNQSELTITDDDSAASNGTAVNVVPETFGIYGHLESTTAGNADAVFEDSLSGEVLVTDNDSPGGTAVYFDEDADEGSRFLADLSSYAGNAVWFLSSNGNGFKVTHDASASSNGVQLYFDDDASDAALRLLFVSPTDADGSEVASREVGAGLLGIARGVPES